ncbi:hypothetical protein INT43_005151 [Umbelopsis isabellina]|uniref:Uncharacterized protein n=1 Tax=Mortierella isabellina TaxID=91625 RepID=A0A8H7PI84_MORIS|nr:hypothetical protein INT43_005151 [Umbelopsis isabellina]
MFQPEPQSDPTVTKQHLTVTDTPAKPHSYEDDETTKGVLGQQQPEQNLPVYAAMKPNAVEEQPTKMGFVGSLRRSLQAKNSTTTRAIGTAGSPEVGTGAGNLKSEEEEKSFFGTTITKKPSSSSKKQPDRDPFNPLPDCFQRKPVFHQYPPQFAPIYIPTFGKYIDDGFPDIFPAMQLAPHDVLPEDWSRFLDDITTIGRFSGGQKMLTKAFPITSHALFIGHGITKAVENNMKKGKHNKVAVMVDIWNGIYFNIRGVNVALMNGKDRLNGPPTQVGPQITSGEGLGRNKSIQLTPQHQSPVPQAIQLSDNQYDPTPQSSSSDQNSFHPSNASVTSSTSPSSPSAPTWGGQQQQPMYDSKSPSSPVGQNQYNNMGSEQSSQLYNLPAYHQQQQQQLQQQQQQQLQQMQLQIQQQQQQLQMQQRMHTSQPGYNPPAPYGQMSPPSYGDNYGMDGKKRKARYFLMIESM